MWNKIKEILKMYFYWLMSVLVTFRFICMMIVALIALILAFPFIMSKKVQTVIEKLFDDITRMMW